MHPAPAPQLRTCCSAGVSSVHSLRHLSPNSPGRGRSSSVPGSCGSPSRSSDHLPLRAPDRPPGTRPRHYPERRCCELSPQKPGVEALTPISLGKLGEDGVCVAVRQERTRTGTRTGTGTGPCTAGRSRGSGAPGCAGSRSGDRRPPRAARRLPRTPGMVGCVTGKGPRLAPLNLRAGRRFTV